MKKEWKWTSFLLIAIIVASILSSCIGEKEETPAPTTTAAPTTTVSPTTPPFSFEEIETIRLVVEQSYPQIEEEFSLPFADGYKQILESVGFIAVDEKATRYDATLLVEVTGEALGANYSGRYLYTGACIECSFSLSAPNAETITRRFGIEESCPFVYTSTPLPEMPSDAPFESLYDVLKLDLFLFVYDVWGIDLIIKALEDEDEEIRMDAAWTLGDIGPEAKDAIPTLINLLEDEDILVRVYAAEALYKIDPERCVTTLIALLEHGDGEIRSSAADALGMIGPEAKDAIPALINLLEDEDEFVRLSTTVALGDIGAQEAVPALINALKDEDFMVRNFAAESLTKITGEDFGEDQSKWQQWWEENK